MTANQVKETGTDANMFSTVSSGMTNVTLDTESRQTVTVDGVNYFAYPVDKKESSKAANAGSVTVMLIPGGSGKTVTTEFKVESGSTVKTFNVVVDSAVAKGGKKNLTYVALDENGDEVTDYRVLKEVKTGNEKFYWEKANGKVNLVFNDAKKTPSTAGSTVSAVFTLPSYETRLVTVNIGEASVPASVAGIDSEVALATRKNTTGTSTNKVTIPFDKLSIYDQYGNKANTSGFATTAAGATTGQLAIMLVAEDSNNDIFKNTTENGVYDDKNVYVIGSSESFNIVANDENMLGTESFTLKIVKKGATKWEDYESDYTTTSKVNFTQTGAFTTTLTVTEDERFKSYEVNTIDKMYDTTDPDYEKEVTVYGVINTGAKVKLTAGTDFKVVPGENLQAGSDASKLATNTGSGSYLQDQHTTTGKYQVIINYKGDTIDRTTTICDNKPVTASLELDNDLTGINIAENNFNLSASADARTLLANIKGKDTYGEDITINKTGDVGTVTFKDDAPAPAQDIIITASDIDTEDGKVANNGTKTPTFTGFVAGDSFTVTFAAGDAKFSTVVSIQEATGATSDVDAIAPTAQVSGTSTSLVFTFDEELYDVNGVAIAAAPTIGDLFEQTGVAYTTVAYNSIAKTLTLTGDTAEDTENVTIKSNTLFDAAGNPVESITATYNATFTKWATETTAPTVTSILADSTDPTTKVVLTFDEELYYASGSTLNELDNTNAAAAFTLTTVDSGDNSAVTATYSKTDKTITLKFASAVLATGDDLKLATTKLYDASGNMVAAVQYDAIVNGSVVTWAVHTS